MRRFKPERGDASMANSSALLMDATSLGSQYQASDKKYSLEEPSLVETILHPAAAASRLAIPGVSNQLTCAWTLAAAYADANCDPKSSLSRWVRLEASFLQNW